MVKRKTVTNRAERAREAFADHQRELQRVSPFDALMPWLHPLPWLHIEYQLVEIRLEEGQAHIRCERMRYKDGKVTEETLEAWAPVAQYVAAVDQLQQQVQQTMQLMLLPWMVLMQPLSPHRR